jgi:dUTP pyrophosphatase
MQPITLKIKRLANCHDLPRYATAGAAGMDLTAGIDKPITVNAGERCRIPCGIIVEIPQGYEGQVRPRSGLADRAGIALSNCVGTIDSDYRGEVICLIINHGDKAYTFEPGERIAQLLIKPVLQVEVVEVDELDDTSERGAGGFGSTGKKTLASSSTAKA